MQTWATLGTELRSWAGHPRGRPGWSSQFPVSALLPSVSLSSCLKESKAHFSAKLKISILLLQCARLCFHKFFNSFHFQGNLEFQALVREGPPTTSPPPPSPGHCGQGAPETTSAASLLLISDVLTNTRPRLEHCGYVCAFVSPGKNDRPRETSFRPCADCQYLADTPMHSLPEKDATSTVTLPDPGASSGAPRPPCRPSSANSSFFAVERSEARAPVLPCSRVLEASSCLCARTPRRSPHVCSCVIAGSCSSLRCSRTCVQLMSTCSRLLCWRGHRGSPSFSSCFLSPCTMQARILGPTGAVPADRLESNTF